MRRSVYYGQKSLSAKFYDVLTDLDPSVRGDVDFYAKGLGPSDVVLELGCGTGRVALALARMGLRVIGLDLAESMVADARQKARLLPPQAAARLQFLVGDMLALDLPIRVQRIIVPFYTLNLVPQRARRAEALKIAARHLAPGGSIMVHTLPMERLQIRRTTPVAAHAADITVAFDGGGRLELTWGERRVDAGRQVTTQSVIYRHRDEAGAILDESAEDLTFGWISEKEMRVSAEKAGLVVREIRTGFVEGEGGQEMIYVLDRPG